MLRKCQNERTSEGVRAMVSFFIAYLFDFTHRTNEHNSPTLLLTVKIPSLSMKRTAAFEYVTSQHSNR